MSKKKRLQIQRDARVISHPVQERQALYFFKVWIDGEDIARVEQFPDWPFGTTEENGNLLSFTGAGFAIHVTWTPFKPEPRSELRYKGYLAIMADIGGRDPKLAQAFREGAFGFGHPEGAQVEFHKPESDDA